MIRPRVIPVLTLEHRSLVKTTQFADPLYLGDPVNAVRIFNSKEVDELVILDITSTKAARPPDLDYIAELAGECFMPLAYGGGVRTVEHVEAVLRAGVEKVIINTAALDDESLVPAASAHFGSQAVVVSIDVMHRGAAAQVVRSSGGSGATPADATAWARSVELAGAGEILLTSVDRDGTATGYDIELVSKVAAETSVPVIACGGAGSIDDVRAVLRAGAAAAGVGRIFVTRGKHRAALISYLPPDVIESLASD